MNIYFPIIFPNIEEDIITQKRTVYHAPLREVYSVGDRLLITNDCKPSSIIANATITSICQVKLINISNEALNKVNVKSLEQYMERLFSTYREYNLTINSILYEVEFEYNPPLTNKLIQCYVECNPKD